MCGLAPLFQFSPALFYTALTKQIISAFEGGKPKATNDLGGQFKQNLGGFFQNAIPTITGACENFVPVE